jgi:hypothetical protein
MMQSLSLNPEDRGVYRTWRRNIILFYGAVAVAIGICGAILAPDLTLTPDQRMQMALQSGMYP